MQNVLDWLLCRHGCKVENTGGKSADKAWQQAIFCLIITLPHLYLNSFNNIAGGDNGLGDFIDFNRWRVKTAT